MTYFMAISIGPVQEFIASARRSRDLWFSSWLLSELSKAAAIAILDMVATAADNAKLVFPFPESPTRLHDDDFTVANVIAAVVDEPLQVGQRVRQQLDARLQFLADRALAQIDNPVHNLHTLKIAQLQIQDLVECTWAATPIEAGDYVAARRKTLALLAARKGTRNFPGIPWQQREGRQKSSLDGRRESVIPEHRYPSPNDSQAVQTHKAAQLYRLYKAGGAERLSGVDLLKRLGTNSEQDVHFPSTSHMAAQPFLQRLHAQGTGAIAQFDALVQTLKRLGLQPERVHRSVPNDEGYDGSLLFASRIQSLGAEQGLDEPKIQDAMTVVTDFLKAIAIGTPAPYYALLVADGDRMGKVIDAQPSLETHQQLSATLSRFAEKVKSTVAAHRGALIYAGGDDIMALLPLHHVLACTEELARLFYTQMADYQTVDEERATLSAGIAICHHLEPLSDALPLARSAEKTAKRFPNKNAVAVLLDKRSGAARTVVGPLLATDQDTDPTAKPTLIERLRYFADAHRQEQIPDGAAYQLRNLFLRLTVDQSDPIYAPLQAAIRTDALRILDRGQADRGRTAIEIDIKAYIHALLADGQSKTTDKSENRVSDRDQINVDQLATELIIAREFAAAQELAYGRDA